MRYVIAGLSITSAWGNGHATTFRSLVKAMADEGHRVTFLERDVPWYREHRDFAGIDGVEVLLYASLKELFTEHVEVIRNADVVMVGSYVPDGAELIERMLRIARGVTTFYDIDTPITLAGLTQGDTPYLTRRAVPRFDLYLSFTGGPSLERLEHEFGAQRARPLYCSVDPTRYYPMSARERWQLGYLGTYSADRQPGLEQLLLTTARERPSDTFVVAGAQYPASVDWPPNVEHREHVAPEEHREFYASMGFTLNLTRAEMVRAGYSPSVRLFEAAACGVPIISDVWPGLSEFFRPGTDILTASSSREVLDYLQDMTDRNRSDIARNARAKVLALHTSSHRVAELDAYVNEVRRDPGFAQPPAQESLQ